MIGANGAGKSTLLNASPARCAARHNAIMFHGVPISGAAGARGGARGIAMVPEGRRLFPSLTVEENLLIGGQLGRKGPWNLERVYELFPVLAERRHLPSPSLSGGQQQMVAIGRALMANPRLLLCDEISLGLAPIVVRDIYARIAGDRRRGPVADHRRTGHRAGAEDRAPRYCMQEGRVALAGRGEVFDARKNLRGLFRGLTWTR